MDIYGRKDFTEPFVIQEGPNQSRYNWEAFKTGIRNALGVRKNAGATGSWGDAEAAPIPSTPSRKALPSHGPNMLSLPPPTKRVKNNNTSPAALKKPVAAATEPTIEPARPYTPAFTPMQELVATQGYDGYIDNGNRAVPAFRNNGNVELVNRDDALGITPLYPVGQGTNQAVNNIEVIRGTTRGYGQNMTVAPRQIGKALPLADQQADALNLVNSKQTAYVLPEYRDKEGNLHLPQAIPMTPEFREKLLGRENTRFKDLNDAEYQARTAALAERKAPSEIAKNVAEAAYRNRPAGGDRVEKPDPMITAQELEKINGLGLDELGPLVVSYHSAAQSDPRYANKFAYVAALYDAKRKKEAEKEAKKNKHWYSWGN